MKKILVTFLILGLIGVIGLIFIKNNYVKAYDINLKDNLSLCSNCLIVTQYPAPNPFNSYNGYTTMKFKVTTSQYLTIYIVNMYHDLGWFTYTNCSGANDGVGYCKEIIKIVFPRQWVNANVEYSVTWTGNTESGYGWITKGVYYFQFVFSNSNCITENIPIGVTFAPSDNRTRYVTQARSWINCVYTSGHVSRERIQSCSYSGVDCTGFVLGVAREMGFNINYPEMLAGWLYNNYGSCSNITSGHTENWQNAPIGWIYFFDWDIPYTSGILDLDHVGICSQWINNNRYMIHAWNTVVEELATAHGGKIYAAYLTSIGQ